MSRYILSATITYSETDKCYTMIINDHTGEWKRLHSTDLEGFIEIANAINRAVWNARKGSIKDN
jgi:hypothetical protein